MVKRLQSAGIPAPVLTQDDAAFRPSPAELRRLAGLDQTQPPAVLAPPSRPVLINFRATETLANRLAQAATAQGVTQKLIITRALASVGIDVPSDDLEDRTPRRRRG